jgi:signal transduction histidine kinase
VVERLQREVAEREDLLNVVSHELRTPVTIIAGYSRLLLSEGVGCLNAEQRRFLGEIERSCRRLSELVGDILRAATKVRGDLSLDLEDRPLAPTIEGVASLHRPLLEQKGLRIEIELSPKASRARFDAMRVEQVLTNLLGNAIRYAPTGSTIVIAVRRLDAGDDRLVELSVSDQGPGVAAQDRERIFEPYVRGARAGSRDGLGLGLAICKRLVEAHNGTIAVADAPGGGSRFSFTLLAADPLAESAV